MQSRHVFLCFGQTWRGFSYRWTLFFRWPLPELFQILIWTFEKVLLLTQLPGWNIWFNTNKRDLKRFSVFNIFASDTAFRWTQNFSYKAVSEVFHFLFRTFRCWHMDFWKSLCFDFLASLQVQPNSLKNHMDIWKIFNFEQTFSKAHALFVSFRATQSERLPTSALCNSGLGMYVNQHIFNRLLQVSEATNQWMPLLHKAVLR